MGSRRNIIEEGDSTPLLEATLNPISPEPYSDDVGVSEIGDPNIVP